MAVEVIAIQQARPARPQRTVWQICAVGGGPVPYIAAGQFDTPEEAAQRLHQLANPHRYVIAGSRRAGHEARTGYATLRVSEETLHDIMCGLEGVCFMGHIRKQLKEVFNQVKGEGQ